MGSWGGKGNQDFKTCNLELETNREQRCIHLLELLGCSGLQAQSFILGSNENRSAQKAECEKSARIMKFCLAQERDQIHVKL